MIRNLFLLFQSLQVPIAPVEPISYSVAVVGDNQNGPNIFSQICNSIRLENVDAFVGLGDHIQNRGAIPSEWIDQFINPLSPIMSLPRWGARGNHDDVLGYQLFFWNLPVQQNIGQWTAFTLGSVRWVILDANDETFDLRTSMDPGHPQRIFIDREITSQEWIRSKFRIVLFHEPATTNVWYSNCYYQSYQTPQWISLMDRLQNSGCHLVLNGHAHGYERSLWRNGPMWKITSGGGGGALDTICGGGYIVALVEHHFLKINISYDSIEVRVLSPQRTLRDLVVIR